MLKHANATWETLQKKNNGENRRKFRNALIMLTFVLMENKRGIWKTIKVANFDKQTDNFIEWESPEKAYLTFNKRKGGSGYNHVHLREEVPPKLSRILYYWRKHYLGDAEWLVLAKGSTPFTGEKAISKVVTDTTKEIIGESYGILDLRRVQATAMGLPESPTTAAVEALASKFHHTAKEHLNYFRKNAHNAQEESDDK